MLSQQKATTRSEAAHVLELPESGLRRRYLEAWADRLASPLPEGVLDSAVEQTAGFDDCAGWARGRKPHPRAGRIERSFSVPGPDNLRP